MPSDGECHSNIQELPPKAWVTSTFMSYVSKSSHFRLAMGLGRNHILGDWTRFRTRWDSMACLGLEWEFWQVKAIASDSFLPNVRRHEDHLRLCRTSSIRSVLELEREKRSWKTSGRATVDCHDYAWDSDTKRLEANESESGPHFLLYPSWLGRWNVHERVSATGVHVWRWRIEEVVGNLFGVCRLLVCFLLIY